MIKLSENRTIDENGFLKVRDCRIMKAGVNPYIGREIPQWKELGLDPGKLYQVYRPFEEFAPNAATFEGLPILKAHQHIDSDKMSQDDIKAFQIGSVGTGVTAKDNALFATLTFTDKKAVEEITADLKKELSPCYRYKAVLEKGTYEGKPYDIKMTNIRGNHLAKIKEGRQGPDVVVADEKPANLKEILSMNFKRTREALMSVFAKQGMAADDAESAIESTLAKLGDAGEAIEEAIGTALEAEAEVTGETPPSTSSDAPLAERLNALLTRVQDAELKAEIEDIIRMLDTTSDEKPKEDKPAMDSATVFTLLSKLVPDKNSIKQEVAAVLNARSTALEEVRPLTGRLEPLAFDSAESVYEYALKNNGVTVGGKNDLETLRSMTKVLVQSKQPAMPAYAMDSKQPATKAQELITKLKKGA